MVELIKPSDFPSLSRFDPDLVELRNKWSGSAICEDHQWHRISENETSDSSPFDMRDNDNLRGKAKPGHLDPSVSRAAHEKIAADLAAMLDLPIPPATLYRLPEPVPDCPRKKRSGDPNICILAWAFPACDEWRHLQSQFTEAHLASAVDPCSAMWVFDSWISADDRDGSKHIVVDANLGPGPLRLAFIDYAFSLSRTWERSGSDIGAAAWQMPMPADQRDRGIVDNIVDRISSLDDGAVEEVVKRIDADWLPEARSAVIISNLLSRKSKIADVVSAI